MVSIARRGGRATQAARNNQPVRILPNVTRTSVSLGNTSISDDSSVDEANQPGPSTSSPPPEDPIADPLPSSNSFPDLQRKCCGICDDEVLYDPIMQWPRFITGSSEPKQGATGMVMLCGYEHVYCYTCLSTYLRTKLEEAGQKSVFPISCPGPVCRWWICEIEVKMILTKSEMETMWYWAKLFDDVPTFYCPIGTCGARIALPDPECRGKVRRADCPACKETFCFKCQVKWHEGLSCAKYARTSGALSRDKALQKLAKQFKWRRCPRCRIVVERNNGCRHMSCRCGHQFCYNCGRTWGDGCGTFRSKFCFPTKMEMWPETRSWVTEFLRDVFGMNRGVMAASSTPNRPA